MVKMQTRFLSSAIMVTRSGYLLIMLNAQLKKAEKAVAGADNDVIKPRPLRTQICAEQIAEVVARSTGIPVSRMVQGEREKLLHIGVYKTELCVALAAFLFDAEDALIRIDMSEFMEKHSVARLIGAPPGYVCHEEGGYLTEAVRLKPYSVILLDEIENAHQDVFNVLLQALDDGRMTDGQGRTVEFKNTVIVMTSNLGSNKIQSIDTDEPDVVKLAVMAEVRGHFRPEFIDEIVAFHAFDEKNIGAIAKIQLHGLEERLAKMEMTLDIDDEALQKIEKAGFDPIYGARPLKRAIQQQIENPLSKAILSGRFGPKDTIPVRVRDDGLVFERTSEEALASCSGELP